MVPAAAATYSAGKLCVPHSVTGVPIWASGIGLRLDVTQGFGVVSHANATGAEIQIYNVAFFSGSYGGHELRELIGGLSQILPFCVGRVGV